ncbi:MAG: TonB-dependent receptor plug domain-containing protein [Parabacteroides sp.]|nr:TonB-dependent receptor plug domain-containing protein [Parabacteroides sp.]
MGKIPFVILSACFTCYLYAQQATEITRDSIVKVLQATFPEPQSFAVYAHTDRSVYYAGETICWKLYPVDRGQDGKQESFPTLFAVLSDRQDSRVQTIKISDRINDNDTFLKLPDTIQAGFYTFALLTDTFSMDKALFRKELQILPKGDGVFPTVEDYEVEFYPEGGKLLGGTACRVAFRAENSRKQPVAISGHIQNLYGDTCARLSSSSGGIGSFSFVPQTGMDYFLVCQNADRLPKTCPLPKVEATGEALAAGWKKDLLIVSRKTGGDVDRKAIRYLSVCSEQALLFWNQWDPDKEYFFFRQAQLPDGPLQLVLYDESLRIVSQRSVFSGADKKLAHTTVQVEKQSLAGPVKRLSGQIKVTDRSGKPLACNLSVSIIAFPDSSGYTPDGSLWRTCCLPATGWDFSPSLFTYMGNEGTLSTQALDDLMLTLKPGQPKDTTTSPTHDIDKHIYLDPVEVKAFAISKKKHDTSYSAFADLHIGRKEIEQRKLTEVTQVFRGYPSIRIMPDRTLRIRGATTTPLIVIDDIPLSYTVSVERWLENPPLEQLSIEDIERIDVIQGARAAIFGMYGGSGVVCITTRTGKSDQEKNVSSAIDEPAIRTLFWQPDLKTDAHGTASFSLPALIHPSDKIQIQIEGFSLDGTGTVVFGLHEK